MRWAHWKYWETAMSRGSRTRVPHQQHEGAVAEILGQRLGVARVVAQVVAMREEDGRDRRVEAFQVVVFEKGA
jgi:hypothetical protein